ncbi:MAG TPA: sensor histidine kinase [Candidatus Acidoferrales bacterium]|nr:sensor histidine kinase [Candidatus Acidoferrales bacterium]
MVNDKQLRVLVVAPTGRDARLLCDMLGNNGVVCERIADVRQLCEQLRDGAGAILLTEEALGPGALECLSGALGSQPRWSDVPVILLTGNWERIDAAAHQMFRQKVARGNLVIMEKPVRPLSLRSAVDAALITRTRQYELRDYQEELQALTAKLIEAQEAESKRLARELHDDFGQKLAVLGMEMAALARRASSQEFGGRLLQFTAQIGDFAKDIHQISQRLHPAILDDLGLAVALRNECAAFSEKHGIPTEFDPGAIPRSVPGDISLCLYRVAQECLRNAGKHAKAACVQIALSGSRDEIAMEIADVGNGFDPEHIKGKGRLGLISMEERVRLVNGAFSIRSQPGKGTQVKVRVPLRRREP